MLVLTRKIGEQIVIPECEIVVTLLEIRGNKVRIGVDAPEHIKVHRKEVWLSISNGQQPVSGS